MTSESFGEFIRRRREEQSLPLRKVAAHLDIDQSMLSKVERGERIALPSYLGPLSDILQLELKIVQAKFIADKISKDFGKMEYLNEGLKEAQSKLKKKSK